MWRKREFLRKMWRSFGVIKIYRDIAEIVCCRKHGGELFVMRTWLLLATVGQTLHRESKIAMVHDLERNFGCFIKKKEGICECSFPAECSSH